jgi:two-component system sensor histidine kinase HydH
VAGIPVIFSGYLIARTSINAIVAEKQQKLFGAARMLDQHLLGSYDDILRRKDAQNAGKAAKVAVLNEELAAFTDAVADAYPGIGVGYYSIDLDAIVTYGPSDIYADKVGLPISPAHEGRLVMATGIPRVQEGELVRGQIMNAMHPVKRGDRVIGYVWANELTADILSQINVISWQIAVTILLCLVIGSIGVALVVDHLVADIEVINRGVHRIRGDLSYRLQPPKGEVGEIATAINEMAQALVVQKRLEEQVQRADRLSLIGEMAAGMAHEIRNPLMAIRGFAQLQGEESTSQEQKEYNDIIVREVDRMNQLIEQLLYFSRPTLARLTDVNVNEVLKNTLILVDMRAKSSRTLFATELAGDLPLVRANEEQLEQVFLNLLINAIQAIPKEGLIRIVSRLHPELFQIRVSITDSGSGIAPENMDKLFDPFFTTKETGTGLGLSVAHHIMEIWGGSIEVKSVLDKGSTFTLIFPMAGGTDNGNDNFD